MRLTPGKQYEMLQSDAHFTRIFDDSRRLNRHCVEKRPYSFQRRDLVSRIDDGERGDLDA